MTLSKLLKTAIAPAIALFTLVAAGFASGGSWVETTATISGVTKVDKDKYAYNISYDATASAAVTASGKPIKRVNQSVFTDKQPQDNQQVRVRYERKEPIIYKLVEPLKLVGPTTR